jgi:SsrA-binding protein
VELYFVGPFAKVELALARGKKLHDKRDATAEREVKREMDRARHGRR